MINGISTLGITQASSYLSGSSQTLTEDQKTAISEVMENYDSESLTESDASEIVSQIEDLGVSPGRGLADALSDVGFDAREIGELAGVKQSSGEAGGPKGDGGRPPPPSESGMTGQINRDAISALQVLIDGYDETDLTEDDWTNIMTTLEESGFDVSKGLMDVKV